jgi:hypothetical protein
MTAGGERMVAPDDGWITLSRKLLVNPLWRSEPFSKGQAWVDLLLLANHKDGYFFNRGVRIDVKRGQVGMSELQLSLRWKWSRTKVNSFFKVLEKEQQIKQHRNAVNTLITIVNYNLYQPEKQLKEQQKDNRSATEVQQKSTNKNDKNEKKNKDSITLSSSKDEAQAEEEFYLTKKKRKLTGKRLETFLTFWTAFDYKAGKAEAADSWLDIQSLTVSLVTKIVEAAKKEAAARPGLVAKGKTPKMAQGWLTARRWEDEAHIDKAGKKGLSDDFEKTFCGTD